MNHYELLLRHSHLLTADTLVLSAQAELPAAWRTELQHSQARVLTWDWLTAQAHALPEQVRFALPQSSDLVGVKRVILFWPKAKPLALALLALIATQPVECYVIGANDAGGKSIGKNTQALCHSAEKIDSARHCTLWELALKPTANFNWLTLAQSFSYQEQSYLTLPGVFNHGKLDTGTALLLEYVPAPSKGRVLDLGCGSGVIGLSMKARETKLAVTLADIDALALQSARLNSARLGLDVQIEASNGLAQLVGKFDFIFTNPPFHQGKETNYQFARDLFSQAKQHLHHDGQLWLVANNHLPYENWAAEYFSQVEVMAQERGFKIILASS